MASFSFQATVTAATQLSTPWTASMPRWQRKALEKGIIYLNVDTPPVSGNTSGCSLTPTTPCSGSKTPGKSVTPGKRLSPAKFEKLTKTSGGGGGSKTPTIKTPTAKAQDRFIPNRSTTDVDFAHYAVMNGAEIKENEEVLEKSLVSARLYRQYHQKMEETLADGRTKDSRVLSFRTKASQAGEGYANSLKTLYGSGVSNGPRTPSRHIPAVPEKVLDAPELLNDFYVNIVDWSDTNLMAVALGGAVYIWNGGDGNISHLMQLENESDHITSLAWIKEGNVIAVGLETGVVQLWDIVQNKLMRTMGGHRERIPSLSWNSYILSSGCRNGSIHHHDVRVADHHVATLSNHTQEICGLTWSADGHILASGGNDNIISLWDINNCDVPVHTLTLHQAAVKALAWCPWESNVLASGGGAADHTLRVWSRSSGACTHSVDMQSQISSVLWNTGCKELITGHGFPHNQLSIWKYPQLTKVTDLTGHTSRVLCLSQSPDGSSVASAAGDETIRIWKCWEQTKDRRKAASKSAADNPHSLLASTIR